MSRLLFGLGARGPLIADLQSGLVGKGFAHSAADGQYGPNTVAAVTAFQQSINTPPTGTVSDADWTGITDTPAPDVEARCLQLTSTFEGHGYSLAKGNWDGAGLTWGIIAFTLAAGSLQSVIRNVQQNAPECLALGFGTDLPKLLQILAAPWTDLLAWANSITVGQAVAEPWLTHFAEFGAMPQVQAEQRARAHDEYFVPALKTAAALGVTSELGIALCFDIHVQNGGLNAGQIQSILAQHAGKPEAEIREAAANAAADHAKPKFQADVRARKLAIARGQGTVHGAAVTLANWGLTTALAVV
jgi:peptidoglycan hydrolase-like protein with peptidoglycan-binding domain